MIKVSEFCSVGFTQSWNRPLLVFCQKWLWFFFVWAEAMEDCIELVSEPCDGFLSLAKFDGQSVQLGQVLRFFSCSHDGQSSVTLCLHTSCLDVGQKLAIILCLKFCSCKFVRVPSREEDS